MNKAQSTGTAWTRQKGYFKLRHYRKLGTVSV
jgi:hypothetical protein